MTQANVSEPVVVLVPTGALGAGVIEEELAYGLAQGAQVIASDAGSTDSGAAYLAKLRSAMAAEAAKVPSHEAFVAQHVAAQAL